MGKLVVVSTLLILSLIFPVVVDAWEKEVLSATIHYYMSKDETEKEGKVRAIENAKIKALADKFGTYINLTVNMTQRIDGLGESESYNSYSSTDVAGVWLKTIEERTDIYVEGNDIVIQAYVKGEARSRSITTPEFEVYVGRVDISGDLIPSTQFKNRERFDIFFVSPQNGYVAIYASDGKSDACRLLPEASSPITEPIYIEAHHRYRFFEDLHPVMSLGIDEESALLRITIIFLPAMKGKPFQLPIDSSKISPQGDVIGWLVGNESYNKWLGKIMSEPLLQRRDLVVSIKK